MFPDLTVVENRSLSMGYLKLAVRYERRADSGGGVRRCVLCAALGEVQFPLR